MSVESRLSTTMSTFSQGCLVVAAHLIITVSAELCENGHTCPASQRCCADTCCLPDHYITDRHHYHGFGFRWSIWNMWYFWFILIFILMSCFGGCGYWRRRQLLLAQHQQHMMGHYDNYHTPSSRATYSGPHLTMPVFPAGYDPSIFGTSGTAIHARNNAEYATNPPQQFFPSPPPYSEVMAKPEVWPPSKDELPPYPGEPVVSANQATEMPQNAVGGEPFPSDSTAVPGLPPYSSINTASSESATLTAENAASACPENSATPAQPSCNSGVDSCATPAISSLESSNANLQINARSGQEASPCVPDVQT